MKDVSRDAKSGMLPRKPTRIDAGRNGVVNNFGEKVNFIWSVADLLRGPYRPNQYKDVMLPLTVLPRLDCVLEPTKDAVLAKLSSLKGSKITNLDPILNKAAGQSFHNTSRFTFEKLKGDPNNIAANITCYIKGFSGRAREILAGTRQRNPEWSQTESAEKPQRRTTIVRYCSCRACGAGDGDRTRDVQLGKLAFYR